MSKFLENLTLIDLNNEERPKDIAALRLSGHWKLMVRHTHSKRC